MKISNKFLLLTLLLLIVALIGLVLFSCDNESDTEPTTYTIKYLEPEFGGYYVLACTEQKVEEGKDGNFVQVAPFEGYKFIEWSDGVKNSLRQEVDVHHDITVKPIFSKINIIIEYFAGEGGHIVGELIQQIVYGESSQEVVAIPDDGYIFAGWSDGILSEKRIDYEVLKNKKNEATFIKAEKILSYQYDIPAVLPQTVVLSGKKLHDVKFYLPSREGYIFDGWYLDREFTIKVTDGNGYYFRGNTIFYDKGDKLYPKWITKVNQTFKILLVFIEESHAKLANVNKDVFEVDYRMELYERETYKLIQGRISSYLNDWFDGDIVFEVDTFFATVPISIESFYDFESIQGNFELRSDSHRIYADRIPEIYPLLGKYRSIITTGGMNDYEQNIHNFAGIAKHKYAYIAMESLFYGFLLSNDPLESYLDPNNKNWNALINTYLHEFAHTVEEGYPKKDLHDVQKHYWEEYGMQGRGIDLIRLYLLNKTLIDNECVGIPINFWTGDLAILINYQPSTYQGYDSGKIIPYNEDYNSNMNGFGKKIPFGTDITVEAIPYEGFKFIAWSDGVKTAIRHEVNIISPIRVYAIFEKIE